MSENEITIQASDYKYPTREELKTVYEATPELNIFDFQNDETADPFSMEFNLREQFHNHNLPYWDGVLLNKNGLLSLSYERAIVNYMRGVPDDVRSFEHKHYVNRIQFDFYAEAFYYHFASVKDTVAQILKVYYVILAIKDKRLYLNDELAEKIPDHAVAILLKAFLIDTEVAKEYRNSFTHRAPIHHPDTRIDVKWETSTIINRSTKDSYEKSSMIKANMDQTMHAVAKFLNDLKPLLPFGKNT